MQTRTGKELHPADKRHVLAAYVYRMTHESVRRWPDAARTMREGGFRLPLLSDDEWLAVTEFRVRQDGRLDRRAKFCLSHRPR